MDENGDISTRTDAALQHAYLNLAIEFLNVFAELFDFKDVMADASVDRDRMAMAPTMPTPQPRSPCDRFIAPSQPAEE